MFELSSDTLVVGGRNNQALIHLYRHHITPTTQTRTHTHKTHHLRHFHNKAKHSHKQKKMLS